jgi:ComF family protein
MSSWPFPFRQLLEFALPPRCPGCGVTVDDDNRFCGPCWQALNFIVPPWCSSCGRPFAFDRPGDMICGPCIEHSPAHDGIRAVTVYDDLSRQIPMRLKYRRQLGMAELIAEHQVRFMGEFADDAVLVPVPLHRWRLWSRGFNQSVLIARSLAKRTGHRVETGWLQRHRATPPLRSMTGKQRAQTVKGAFRIRPDAAAQICGTSIILVDDVYTSGATGSACAKLLKKAGARSVVIFCWARVLDDTVQ